jgi:UDPglucose 6-dehydrogenase
MRVAIIGTGYIGLTEGVCFADIGHQVICVDKNPEIIEKLQKGIPTLYEEGLETILARNIKNGRISFTTDIKEALQNTDIVLIAVNTPENPKDGSADLTAVYGVAKEIAKNAGIQKEIVVVVRSTVPVGTNKEVKKIIKKANPKLKFEIASNPEFSKQGSAIKDFLSPDRVIIGVENEKAKKTMGKLYEPIERSGYPILFTEIETAELIKYASNSFLAVKIGFINEMSELCRKSGADVKELAKAMGMDNRISDKFLNPGPGYGGSCFPKDTSALVKIGEKYNVNLAITNATIKSNKNRKIKMADIIVEACGNSVKDKTICILGLAFKANTDDTRYSPALVIIEELIKKGAKIKTYDPQAMKKAKEMLSTRALKNTTFYEGMYDAMKDSDAMVIATEWKEFKDMDLKKFTKLVKTNIMIDLRSVFDKKILREKVKYYSIC